jgi:hypothetical protein
VTEDERERAIRRMAEAWTNTPFPSSESRARARRAMDKLDELDYASREWVSGLNAVRRSRDRAENALRSLAELVVERGHHDTCGAALTEQPGDCNCPWVKALEIQDDFDFTPASVI